MSLRHSYRSYRRLPGEERLLARLSIALLALARPMLAWVRVDEVERIFDRVLVRWNVVAPPEDKRLSAARRTARIVAASAERVWPGPSCLHRSLVLKALLRSQGIESDLRLGVRREDGRFQAHAWVEYEHEPLTEPGDSGSPYEILRPWERVTDGGAT